MVRCFFLFSFYSENVFYLLKLILAIFLLLLANSANSNCRPFQVKSNCSKFIIDGLQQRCHMALLVSLFVASRHVLFGVFLPRKIITILQKITKFQARVTEMCISLSKSAGIFRQNTLKVPVKKLNLWKNCTAYERLCKLLRFPVRFFSPIYRNLLFGSYIAVIFCSRIHICKKFVKISSRF